MNYAIEVYNLKKKYIKEKRFAELLLHPFKKEIIHALNGISLRIKKGEICGLLGPNGAGKTTLIKILATLVLPDSGRAYIKGNDVVIEEDNVKNSIGLIHNDERSFFWRLTGRQNLEFFASIYNIKRKDIKKRVDSVIKIVDLKDKEDERFDSYSTGMKQKMAIARGLLTNPDILLIDEPTRGVDPISALKIRKFLKEMLVKKMKKTILIATHDLREAQFLCDNIVILHKGKIRAGGSLEKLSKKVGAELIDIETSANKNIVLSITKIKGVKKIEIEGRRFKIKVLNIHQTLPKIINLISKNNGEIYDCKTTQLDLDKIFERFAGG